MENTSINLTGEALEAFIACNNSLADSALLAHPEPSSTAATLALVTDTSDKAIGAVLQQYKNGAC